MNQQALEVVDSCSDAFVAPLRRTWYGVVGSHEKYLVPEQLTDDHELAMARARVANHDYANLGPWSVVVLTENLRAPQL